MTPEASRPARRYEDGKGGWNVRARAFKRSKVSNPYNSRPIVRQHDYLTGKLMAYKKNTVY